MSRFRLRQFGAIAEIIFDDAQMNLLSSTALDELNEVLDTIPGEARLLVFRSGRPSLFAAGADMAAMREFTADDAERFSQKGQRLFERIERFDFLTLAVVDGDCYGGALDLSLAFDLRWSTRRSRFAHPGAKIGIVTGFGGTLRVPRHLPASLARRLLLGNEVITADEAAQFGLVDKLFESAREIDDASLKTLAARVTSHVPVAKSLLRLRATLPMPQLQLMARRTEQLFRGSRFNGSS